MEWKEVLKRQIGLLEKLNDNLKENPEMFTAEIRQNTLAIKELVEMLK